MKNSLILSAIILLFVAVSCNDKTKDVSTAASSINQEDLKNYISVLASDEFGGRAPASEGEEKTKQYLSEQFEKLGLEPGNNGSWFQEVAMKKITAARNMQMSITGGKEKLALKSPVDFIGGTAQTSDHITINNSDIIFIGYGINSPEYSWNDYQGLDVKGKTVVILVNDPGYATGDTSLFTGKAMTYYGRWTYKYEEAARQGAKAAIIIHETGAAAYPWEVVQNSWSGPQFYLENNQFDGTDLDFKGWITTDAAIKMFSAAGIDYNASVQSAAQRGFKPIKLNLSMSVDFTNTAENVRSNNILAYWPGSERKDELIIYTSHWDHLGINNDFEGDTVLNGAVDNATGVAGLLEIARAFTKLSQRQDRSILFLAVTAEEQGLLGSEYYANNPVFPLNKTAAVINMDALNIFGKTNDMTIIGYGNSELDRYVEAALKEHGRYSRPDQTPEKGSYFRSDHFSFAKKGVPALYVSSGIENIEHGKEWAIQESEKWGRERYHKPSDNFEPDTWNMEGMVEDLRIYFETGYKLSTTSEFPQWKAGFPFRSLRDEMLHGTGQ
ncbi:MAG TPA: M28 family metallopeptidase [Bacteroidales bacterium]|nr:M28 family metallopeptidase [Bacteroidales bacterium]